jgi:hypothetical protein
MHSIPILSHFFEWVIPEEIHPVPKEEISAVQRGREEKFVSDNT